VVILEVVYPGLIEYEYEDELSRTSYPLADLRIAPFGAPN